MPGSAIFSSRRACAAHQRCVARADTNADNNYPQTNALQGAVEADYWIWETARTPIATG
jgi:hypothetical protein